MTSIPEYLIGKLYKNVFVYPVSVTAGTGVIAAGTGVDLRTGEVFDEFEIENNSGLVEISGTAASVENYVPTKASFTCTLSCIRLADGSSPIDTLASGNSYCKVLVNTSADGTTVGWTDAVLMVIDSRTKRSDVGKNTVSISGRPVGVQPYSGSGSPTF